MSTTDVSQTTAHGATGAGAGTTVEYRDVRRAFGTNHALAGLTLTVNPGELLALLGPSGCGKTTALRMLAGFDQPTSGDIFVDGRDISRVPANRRNMGMVFQSYSLFPTMTALDNVAFGLRMRKHPLARRRPRAQELLDLVGLGDRARNYPHELSGGQQQRVALARALAITPRVLLLDEPLSALDAKVREQLRDEIRRLQSELGVTTVFVTHDQEEALSIADRVGVMRAGRLEQCDAPPVLYERPATPFVATFVGSMNRLTATVVEGGQVHIGTQTLPADGPTDRIGARVTALVRPEALQLVLDATGTCVIATATFRGATIRLRVNRPAASPLLVDLPSHRAADFPVGTRVRVELLPRPVLLAEEPAPAGS